MAEKPPPPSQPRPCTYCHDFGLVQVYWTVVLRVYCDCEAGTKRIQSIKKTLKEAGLDPDSSEYQWLRKADIPKYY